MTPSPSHNTPSLSRCRDCGAPINWRETPSGRYQPIDPETGEVHFVTCSARPKRNLPVDVCLKCGSRNVEQGPGAGPHYARLRCLSCQYLRWLPWPVAS
jgi:hypothetical protein